MSMVIPMVIDQEPHGVRTQDIFSRLLEDRVVFMSGAINDHVANVVIAQLLFLASKGQKKDIFLYINSPGGAVTSAMAILDTMNHIKSDVCTLCVGQAASAAAVILSAGAKGKRSALRNAEIMIHQPHGGLEGQVSDIKIAAKRMEETRTNLNKILARNTGQKIDKISSDVERDNYMNSEDAKKYGIIDFVQK